MLCAHIKMPDPVKVPRDFRCPRCGARPREGCETAEGLAWADHAERIALAKAASKRPATSGMRRVRSPRRATATWATPPTMPEVAQSRRLPRDYVRGFTCPQCGSGPNVACVGTRGQPREQNHAGRVAVARAGLAKRSALTVTISVAGVCPDGPGPGGWAALIAIGTRELQLRGHADLTAESRMTLTALIEAFRALPSRPARLTVEVDSEHIERALRNGWPALWLDRGWVKADGTPVRNRDLWELLGVEIETHDVSWQSVPDDAGRRQRVRDLAAAQR